ncbi:MAG: hypothetical protein HY823_05355 [Acidobacteria bacterium]|nr:hypothetical protein [Acidobacteriota bacterium]
MRTLLLFLALSLCWLLILLAGAAQGDWRRAQAGEPPQGTSVVPALPLFPLLFTGLARLLDRAWPPYGTGILLTLHLLAALPALGAILLYRRRLAKDGGAGR